MPPPAPSTAAALSRLQAQVWAGSIALEIHLAPSNADTDTTAAPPDPYLIHVPRLSYLAFIHSRLRAFFTAALQQTPGGNTQDNTLETSDAWLACDDGTPLKWHYPVGLLHDLFSGVEPVGEADQEELDTPPQDSRSFSPWRLNLHYKDFPADQLIPLDEDDDGGEARGVRDAFVNAVKEADVLRNGTARAVMSLSRGDSDALWRAVRMHDMTLFNSIQTKLLNPPGIELRHVPLRIYLPTTATFADDQATTTTTAPIPEESDTTTTQQNTSTKPTGHIRVVQALVPLYLSPQVSSSTSSSASTISQSPFAYATNQPQALKQQQTLGTALHTLLPTLFPSRRNYVLARPILHGVAVPLSAPVMDLCRGAGYADGWVGVVVGMLG